MKILILGGTGAMGVPLVNFLNNGINDVYVTSRVQKESDGKVHYIRGNAHEIEFINSLLREQYDAIVDFMVYSTEEFKNRVHLFLENTKQYVFFSSSRVYAESKDLITEHSSRLLDECKDAEYLSTDEYALSKAREENILFSSGKNNWTIIRPYITYNSYRLQLGVYEKENWLYRALQGRSIVLPKDIAEKTTSLTYGPDVSETVGRLIGEPKALGEVFHIVTFETATWNEILKIYLDIIEKRTGKRLHVVYADDSSELQKIWNSAQIKYDRLYDRKFDSSKVNQICKIDYTKLKAGIEKSISEFIDAPVWLNINYRFEAWADRIAGEKTSIFKINGGLKTKLRYIKHRYF